MNITNNALIDYDLRVTPADQATGLIEEDPALMFGRAPAEEYSADPQRLIPRSRWAALAHAQDRLRRHCVREVKNQGREGSCVGNSGTGAMQVMSHFQFGHDSFVTLSAMSLYKRIGRSPSSGAYIADAVNELSEQGALPQDNEQNRGQYAHVHPATGFRTPLPRGWEHTARLFRVVKWLKVQGADEWMSALLRGKPILYGRRGHAIFSWIPVFERRQWYFGYVNSWGQWGDEIRPGLRGLGYDSERLIESCTGYAVEQVTVRSELAVPAIS